MKDLVFKEAVDKVVQRMLSMGEQEFKKELGKRESNLTTTSLEWMFEFSNDLYLVEAYESERIVQFPFQKGISFLPKNEDTFQLEIAPSVDFDNIPLAA